MSHLISIQNLSCPLVSGLISHVRRVQISDNYTILSRLLFDAERQKKWKEISHSPLSAHELFALPPLSSASSSRCHSLPPKIWAQYYNPRNFTKPYLQFTENMRVVWSEPSKLTPNATKKAVNMPKKSLDCVCFGSSPNRVTIFVYWQIKKSGFC